ncbi:transmembrane protein 198-like isoform X2 [Lampris incognitus]|nr:transmembrane protein 198-like isoform X2 [Lampris incognitus]
MVMFLSGFLTGSAAVFLLYHKEPMLDAQLGMETKAGIGLGAGVLCGLLTMLVYTMGLFLTGVQLGGLLTVAVLVVIGQFYTLTPMWVPLSALLTSCVVFATFTLQWQKLFSVTSTAVFGGATVMLSVDYLVEKFTLTDHVHEILNQVPPRPLCWFSWAITGIWPVLSLMGVLVQWRFTANGVSHKAAAHTKQNERAKMFGCQRRNSRRRAESCRRRKPPPLKRYAGDVLAPSYLQSLQVRQMGTGSSTSSLSTITHTVVDFDFETGSMVPLTASSPVFRI